MSLRPRDRFLTFKNDNFTCQYCGRTPPTQAPISSCHICESAIYENDDYEGWDTDDICRSCVDVFHAESDARLATENAEINAWIAARGTR
jgi:hypothetical protein